MTIINSLTDAKTTIADLKKKAKENSLDIISSKNCSFMLEELNKLAKNPDHKVTNHYTEKLMKQNGLLNEDGTFNNFVKEVIFVETSEQADFSPFAFEFYTENFSLDSFWLWNWYNDSGE